MTQVDRAHNMSKSCTVADASLHPSRNKSRLQVWLCRTEKDRRRLDFSWRLVLGIVSTFRSEESSPGVSVDEMSGIYEGRPFRPSLRLDRQPEKASSDMLPPQLWWL